MSPWCLDIVYVLCLYYSMNIPTFRKDTHYGDVVDIFKHVPLFIGGWPGQYIVHVKTNDISDYMANTLFKLQYKVKHVSIYDTVLYKDAGTIICGGILIVFLGPTLFNMARTIWNARSFLLKEYQGPYSGQDLWSWFQQDHEYGVRRFAELQRQDIEFGSEIEIARFRRGEFGLLKESLPPASDESVKVQP